MTQLLPSTRSTHTCFSHLRSVKVTSSFHDIEDRTKVYVIEDLVNGKRTSTHIHNLRPFNYDPARTSPLAIAQQKSVFEVESINGHRGNRQRHSTMGFKVRWAGFGESYKALLHVGKLHDYLRTNAVKTLIPSEFFLPRELSRIMWWRHFKLSTEKGLLASNQRAA